MKRAILSILFTAFVFSTLEVAGKVISGQLNAFQVTFIRFLIGALIIMPFAIKDIKKKAIDPKKKTILYFYYLREYFVFQYQWHFCSFRFTLQRHRLQL
ncbi:EamA family transporter [Thermobrachium celere]|uniref:EamA family transporter n=1 Tax=Thermobrachium celere TaxID=53422 RepID=UPI001940C549|nr:EamA family transporter [Thermobrachium celere]GFR35694.1 hypothetical protein TCEA9_15060 [Thermobrachium celere]